MIFTSMVIISPVCWAWVSDSAACSRIHDTIGIRFVRTQEAKNECISPLLMEGAEHPRVLMLSQISFGTARPLRPERCGR